MPRKSRKNVGLIGLGIIGSRVATGLRGAGFQVFVWNRSPKPAPNFLGSPAEVAELCDLIQFFVSDAQALFDVLDQMSGVLSSRHVIICNATVGPEATIEAARLVEEKGARFLDAPFTGSRAAAERRDLVYYIGGDDATFLRARPVLEASSKAIVRIGEIGHAATVKVVTNMIAAVSTQTLGEALAIVQKAGLDPEVLAAALEHNACRSGTMDLKLPKMVMGDYEPHFSLKHMFKDVQMGIHIANALDIEIPVTTVTAGVMYGALNQGWGDLDFSALYKTYEPAGPPSNAKSELPKRTDAEQELDPKELHYPETKVAAPPRPLVEPAKLIQIEPPAETPKLGEPQKPGALPRLSSVLNAPGAMAEAKAERSPETAKRLDLPKITPPPQPSPVADGTPPITVPVNESLASASVVDLPPAELVTNHEVKPVAPAEAAPASKPEPAGGKADDPKAEPIVPPSAMPTDSEPEKKLPEPTEPQEPAAPKGPSAQLIPTAAASGTASTESGIAASEKKKETHESGPVVNLSSDKRAPLPAEPANGTADEGENGTPNVKPFNQVKRWFVARPGG